MAGARLHKIGNIFTRVTGLLRSGAMKEEDRPLWYDIYKTFPPKYEPNFTRPVPKNEIPNILYKEDIIRAKFYKEFGSPGIIDMSTEKSSSLCQRFLEKYADLEKNGQSGDLFEETVKALTSEGATLLTKQDPKDQQENFSDAVDKPLLIPVDVSPKT